MKTTFHEPNLKYELVCGLEVHAELKTASKMFCSCKNDPFGAPEPNCYTCPVCLGMPGALPVANKKAIEWTIMVGLALNCQINLFSKFDRKHYFYPDLPKGYQISQYDIPFCHDGFIETSEGKVRIKRIHLEEDTGKLVHDTVDGKKVSLIDFNRSSVPLIEIVTEPDIKSATQAKDFGKKLRQILRYLDVADCNMQEGGMRLEANVSVREKGVKTLPAYKVELKNINSFRFMEQAVEYEVVRHCHLISEGKTPIQETRGWNTTKNETFSQRTKEEAEDYRYFPDPDLPPFRFTAKQVEALRELLPELPDAKAARWSKEFGLEPRITMQLTEDQATAKWFESVFAEGTKDGLTAPALANALINKKVSYSLSDKPSDIISKVAALGATENVDQATLAAAVEQVLALNPDAVAKFKAGETKVMGFFLGQVMKVMGKKVEAGVVTRMIEKKIG